MPDTLTLTPSVRTTLPDHAIYEPKDTVTTTSKKSETLAATGGGDPPKRPNGDLGPKGHYADIDETGRLPIKDLTGIKMASAKPKSPFIDPATKSEKSPETHMLALRQTMAARNLLYNPGPTVREELSGAAQKMLAIAGHLDQRDLATLGTRVLGEEGILHGQDVPAMLGAIDRVAREFDGGNPTATDRAVVLALMGDVGALYADTGATTGVGNRTQESAARLRGHLETAMEREGLHPVRNEDIQRVQRLGGSGAVGPTKKQERTRPPNEKPERTGIHDTGHFVDVDLDVRRDEIQPTRWDVAHIRQDRVRDSAEPLVGHMSGSPAEILQVFDMLRGAPRTDQYTGTMDRQRLGQQAFPMQSQHSAQQQESHYARAAAAGAFLVAFGFHSAVEVTEGILAYTGQDSRSELSSPRRDAVEMFGQGAATDLMNDLFDSFAKPRGEPEI